MLRQNGATADVTIIGGGVIGCAVAYDLARQGTKVQLFDRQGLAQEASWASAGIISAPAPSDTGLSELRLMAFRRYPQLVDELEQETGISTGWHQTGELLLGTAESEQSLEQLMAWQNAHGVRSDWLDADDLHEQEPAVHERFTGGLQVPEVGSVMLERVTLALARAATKRGAVIREHLEVLGLEMSDGKVTGVRTINGSYQSDVVVIAAGAWSRMLSDSLDFTIPTVPVRGQMLAVADPVHPIGSVLAHAGVYIVPRADGTIAVGATEEHASGFDHRVTPGGIAWLAGRLEQMAPTLNQARLVSTWAGLRPGTDDGQPIIGRVPHLENVWLATGHYRGGATLAPATSELLAASILAGDPDPRLSDFDPARLG